MKKYIIAFTGLLICLLMQTQTNLAQMPASNSKTITDLGNLNDKAKTLAKPGDPFDVMYGNLTGKVTVNITVNEKGDVIKAEAVSGDDRLRMNAVLAARDSKFNPYLIKGKAVKFSGFLVFKFGDYEANVKALSKAMEDVFKEQLDLFKLIDKYPDAADLLKSDADIKYEKGDYTGAIASSTEDIKKAPTAPKFELRAKAYFQLKDYDNALKDINTSIEKSAGKANSSQYVLRGDIFKAQYNYVLAEYDYVTALQISPKDESIRQKLNNLRQTKNSTEVEAFQRELKQTLENFGKIKPVYEKKVAEFETLLESEKKKTGNVDVPALCQSLSSVKLAWKWLDPMINKTTDKIGKLQQEGKIDEYFAGSQGTTLLSQNSEMIAWTAESYLPGKEKYAYLFDKLGCKAPEKQ